MKRYWKIAGVMALMVSVAAVGTAVAFAQDETPEPPFPGRGRWGMGPGPGAGIMADYMDLVHERLAEELGISLGEFEEAIAGGETLSTLAEEYGVDFADLREAMQEARAAAIEAAAEDGVLTEDQAARMLEWGARGPFGHGACDGSGPIGEGPFGPGRMGGFRGRFGPPSDS